MMEGYKKSKVKLWSLLPFILGKYASLEQLRGILNIKIEI